MSLQRGGREQESFELVGGSFLRTKLERGTKPTFKAAKTIHPKSKQSRGNPKPIPKELHSKTIHVLAPSQTTARIRSRCRFHWMPKLVEEFVAKVDILLSQEPRKAKPQRFPFLSYFFFSFFFFPSFFLFSNLLTSMFLIPWTFSCWCVDLFPLDPFLLWHLAKCFGQGTLIDEKFEISGFLLTNRFFLLIFYNVILFKNFCYWCTMNRVYLYIFRVFELIDITFKLLSCYIIQIEE